LQNLNNARNISGDEIETGSKMSINFGGEIGYVFGGFVGAEFMANYSPNFELSDTLLQRRPSVSAYMGNALFVVPTHGEHRFSPFVSGGIGAVHMRSTIFTVDPGTTNVNINTLQTENIGGTQFGWDIGGGLFAFNGPWGLRADVRYYKATTDNNISDITVNNIFLHPELSGLSFWDAHFGLTF